MLGPSFTIQLTKLPNGTFSAPRDPKCSSEGPKKFFHEGRLTLCVVRISKSYGAGIRKAQLFKSDPFAQWKMSKILVKSRFGSKN